MPRGIWKGSLSFGLLNIPVILQSAEQDKSLHFKMLDSHDFSPIQFKRVNANTGREVKYDQIVKGYQYEPGEYVVVDEADFQAANPKATQTLDIEDFVPLDDLDPMLFEKPYYLVPQKSGEKGYALLRDALQRKKKVAIGKIVIRVKQHLAAVLPRGPYLVLELLRFAHEVLEADEVDYDVPSAKKAPYSAREFKMAEELINGMSTEWKPDKYKDTYVADLMRRIDRKIKSGKTHAIEEAPLEKAEAPAKVVDLLPLLRKSLAESKRKRKAVR